MAFETLSQRRMYNPHALTTFDPRSLPSRAAHEFQPCKPRLIERNFESLFEFIWRHDSHDYKHPRYRLQIALTILLFFHLGLYPTIALSEGFYYRDTKLLVTKYNGTMRVLLIVCLKDRRKFQNSGKRWSGRTMILADNPSKRHICPVTIFLALALADGVIDGVQGHHLTSLEIGEFPAWEVINYRPETLDFPVMRRALRNTLSPSRALSPNDLHKTVHALIQRAGHISTWNAIRDDNKKAAEREKRRLETTTDKPHLLIGRGQGKLAFELLGHCIHHGNIPCDLQAFGDGTGILENYHPLQKVVEAQLRFDIVRSALISSLYNRCNLYRPIEDVLEPFVEAASIVGSEIYYPGAEPDEHGNCPWCGARPSRIPMKLHLLHCFRNEKRTRAENTHTAALERNGWHCRWGACDASYHDCGTLSAVASHLSDHISRNTLLCEWEGCTCQFKNIVDLHIHLERDHKAYTKATLPTRAEYCFECGIWTTSELEWSMHGVLHARNPNTIYGPIKVGGMFAEVGRCPYCMRNGLYRQMEKPSEYLQHVERHVADTKDLDCPHLSCNVHALELEELHEHLRIVHRIPFPLA